MTRYSDFDKLQELTKLTKTERGYSKFIQKGEIEFYDYNRGFFDVDIYTFQTHKGEWLVRIWLGTIDDGDYGSWTPVESKEEGDTLVQRMVNDIFESMIAFPTQKELNELLRPYGAYVDYE
jgi:hypothetical protein